MTLSEYLIKSKKNFIQHKIAFVSVVYEIDLVAFQPTFHQAIKCNYNLCPYIWIKFYLSCEL